MNRSELATWAVLLAIVGIILFSWSTSGRIVEQLQR